MEKAQLANWIEGFKFIQNVWATRNSTIENRIHQIHPLKSLHSKAKHQMSIIVMNFLEIN